MDFQTFQYPKDPSEHYFLIFQLECRSYHEFASSTQSLMDSGHPYFQLPLIPNKYIMCIVYLSFFLLNRLNEVNSTMMKYVQGKLDLTLPYPIP